MNAIDSKHLTAEDILKKIHTIKTVNETQTEVTNESNDDSTVTVKDTEMQCDSSETHKESQKEMLRNIPRGVPKSGKKWKTEKKTKFSAVAMDKVLKTSWQIKMQKKAEMQSIKNYAKELKEARAREMEERRKRIEINRKRKEENTKKAEIVQVIKDTRKIKNMKKKQLRMIEKR